MRNRTGSGGGGVQLLTASYHRQIQSQGLYTVGFREFVGLLVLKRVLVNLAVGVRPSHAGPCNFKFWVWAPFGLVILLY